MKKILPPVIMILSLFFTACGPVSPEDYFGTAILSSNMLHGFANEVDWRQFESPSVKMVGNSGQTEPMQRKELVETKITFIEANLEKLNDLKETPDTKEMLEVSRELYNHALPVYKTEYVQLAKLYDEGGSKEQTMATARSIQEKYLAKHEELHSKLIALGKVYAKKHNINVMWDIQTSPQ